LEFVSGPDSEGWCGVRVNLDGPAGHWSARDNCLQRFELARLADWFDQVAGDRSFAGPLDFQEPELSFAVVDDKNKQVKVFLRWNFRPVWAKSEPDEEFCQLFPAEPGQLRRAAAALRSMLKRNPKQGSA
jgi:hypothetical protein